jgi:hypothetical protein
LSGCKNFSPAANHDVLSWSQYSMHMITLGGFDCSIIIAEGMVKDRKYRKEYLFYKLKN